MGYKINSGWVFGQILLMVGSLVAAFIATEAGLPGWFNFILWVIIVLMVLVWIVDWFMGGVFYQYKYIPRSEYNVKKYINKLTIEYKNVAFDYLDKQDEIAELESLKAKTYYNINKDPVSFYLVPYQQL